MFFCTTKLISKAQEGHLDLRSTKIKPAKLAALIRALNHHPEVVSLSLHPDTITEDNGEQLTRLKYVTKLDICWANLKQCYVMIIRETLEENGIRAGQQRQSMIAKEKVFSMLREQEAACVPASAN